MKLAAFNAVCPFEIGDKIGIRKNACAVSGRTLDVMKLEAELNKIHGRIIKLLDSIKGYEMESRRLRLEERKYNLAKQKLSGAFDVDPETGEIIDEVDDPCGDPEI